MAPPAEKKKKHSSAEHCSISSAAIGENQQQKPSSVVTSSFGSKMKCHLRKIWICSDVWFDILPFFDRPQLGLKLALLSPRFNALVDKHFDGKSELTIWRELTIRKCAGPKSKLYVRIGAKSVPFPLPDRPLPNKIRFNYLRIEYIDFSVLAFLHSNKQIFDKRGIRFYLSDDSHKNNYLLVSDVIGQQILPIFAPNIRRLDFSDGDLDHLLINWPSILSKQNINSIEADDDSIIVFGDFEAIESENLSKIIGASNCSNATSAADHVLTKWLHTPTKDGQTKQLRCSVEFEFQKGELINNFKKAFLRATISVNYIIHFELLEPMPIEPFELVNEQTNEKLTLSKESENNWVMKRCQIGQMVQWKDEKLNNVSIILSGANCIGPLSPPSKCAEVK